MKCATGMDLDNFFTLWRTHHSESGSLTCCNAGCLQCHYPRSCDGWRLHYSLAFWRRALEHHSAWTSPLSVFLPRTSTSPLYTSSFLLVSYNKDMTNLYSFSVHRCSTWKFWKLLKTFFLKNHVFSIHSKAAIKEPRVLAQTLQTLCFCTIVVKFFKKKVLPKIFISKFN